MFYDFKKRFLWISDEPWMYTNLFITLHAQKEKFLYIVFVKHKGKSSNGFLHLFPQESNSLCEQSLSWGMCLYDVKTQDDTLSDIIKGGKQK